MMGWLKDVAGAGADLWLLRVVLVAGLAVGSFPFWLVKKGTVRDERGSSFGMAVFVAVVMGIAGVVSLIFPGQWASPFYLLWLLVLAIPTGVTIVMWFIGRVLERLLTRKLTRWVEDNTSEYVPGGSAFWVYHVFFIWSLPLLVDLFAEWMGPLGRLTAALTSNRAYDSWPVHAAAWSVWLYPVSVLSGIDSDAECRREPLRGRGMVLSAFACTAFSVWSAEREWGWVNPLPWVAIGVPAALWLHVVHVCKVARLKRPPDTDDSIEELLAKARGEGGGKGRELQAVQILDTKGYRFPTALLRAYLQYMLSQDSGAVDWVVARIRRDNVFSDEELRQLVIDGKLIPEAMIGLARTLGDPRLLVCCLREPKLFWEAVKDLLIPPIMAPNELDALTADAIPTEMCTSKSLSTSIQGNTIPRLLEVAIDKGDTKILSGILTTHGGNLQLLPLLLARMARPASSDDLRASVLRAAVGIRTPLARRLLLEGVLRLIPCDPKSTKRIPFPAVAPHAMEFLVELLAALNSHERRTRRVAVKTFVAASRLAGAEDLKNSLEAAKSVLSTKAQLGLDEILRRWGDTRIPCALSERYKRYDNGWAW